MPVVLSTGMSDIDGVHTSVKALQDGGADDITLLQCTTNYPCPYDQANVKAMCTLRDIFGFEVGFSDHTVGKEASLLAVSLGAKLIEKHFTLDKMMDGPDHAASMEPEEFKDMVRSIRIVEQCMGSGKKEPTGDEREIANVVTKRVVALRPIKKGELFSEENITVKRCGYGEKAERWDSVIGTEANRDYESDEGICV